MSGALKAAYEIMALVDEFPSEPFSYERKMLVEKLELFIAKHTDQMDDELDYSFNLGFDTGANSKNEELKAEHAEEIDYLQSKLDEMEEQVKQAYDEGFAAGIEFHQD